MSRMLLAVSMCCVGAAVAAQGPSAQSDGPALATLLGRVLEAGEGAAPARRARLTLTTEGRVMPAVFADADGRFAIRVVPLAPYTLTIAKAGFLPLSLRLTAPAAAGSLDIRLPRAAAITGTVADPSGRPVAGVGVRARLAGPGSGADAYTTTDDRGEFRLAGLMPGRYDVHSERGPGATAMSGALDQAFHVPAAAMAKLPPLSDAATIDVAAGETAAVTIHHREAAVNGPYALVGGAISGTVRDEHGEPVQGVRVQLWQSRAEGDRLVARPTLAPRLTDDRGRFRVFHVPAGRYVVAVEPHAGDDDASAGNEGYLPDYYPGRLGIAGAAEVQVAQRQEASDIDITVSYTPGSRVFGFTSTSRGGTDTLLLRLVPRHQRGIVTLPAQVVTAGADGAFEIRGVPPGEYVVQAIAGTPEMRDVQDRRTLDDGELPAAARLARTLALHQTMLSHPSERGVQYVHVSAPEVGPIAVTTAPPAIMRGRIVLEGGSIDVSELPLMVAGADPDLASATAQGIDILGRLQIEPGGAFEAEGLFGPVRIVLPPGAGRDWWVKSAYIGPVDAAVEPFDAGTAGGVVDDVTVVLANTAGTIVGTVRDERSQPAMEYWAVVFSTDHTRWFPGSPYVRTTYAGREGRFEIGSLPPGDYWVAAIDSISGDSVSGEWQSVDLLNRLAPGARRIALAERERAATELRLVRSIR